MNIVTVFNSGYIEFAKLFIESLEKNITRSKFDKLYVIDTGIKDEHSWLFQKNYIQIIDTNKDIEFNKIHGSGWRSVVDMKTKMIYEKIIDIENVFPLVLIDGDSFFIRDFDDEIDMFYDLQVAHRPSEVKKPYIASWVSFNTPKSKLFLKEWMALMKKRKVAPYETDCLIKCINKYKKVYKIGNVDMNVVSSLKLTDQVKILHFKSTLEYDIPKRIDVIMDKNKMNQLLNKTISKEYLELNEQLHKTNKTYGSKGDRRYNDVIELIEKTKSETILDYGCGKGQLVDKLKKEGWSVSGFDPAIEEWNTPPNPSDFVVCTDVLEHIEPEYLDNVMNHLNQLMNKGGYFVIANRYDSSKLLSDGTNPHKIVKDLPWWLDKFHEHFFDCQIFIKKSKVRKELIMEVVKKNI